MEHTTNHVVISVLTPTFNRADRLPWCFESLKKQTYKNFEWIIVDDGSTDYTCPLVDTFIKEADFPITYVYKENGGKHTAINEGYKHLKGKFMFTLDSDDAMEPSCMEKALGIWRSIPEENKGKIWSVCGRCRRSDSPAMVGTPFHSKINSVGLKKQIKLLYKTAGEKFSMKVTDIVKEFLFQEPENLKFVPENTVWDVINRQYQQYYTNEIFRICTYDSSNGLSRNIYSPKMLQGRYFGCCYAANGIFSKSFYPLAQYIKTLVSISFFGELLGKKTAEYIYEVKPMHNKIIVALLSPAGKILKKAKNWKLTRQ